MSVDSGVLAAIVLFAAAIGGWRLAARMKPAARRTLRFAAVLLAALAVASAAQLGDGAALLLLPLACAALLLSAQAREGRPLHDLIASLLLAGALACGLTAVLTDTTMPAVAPMAVAALAIIAVALGGLSVIAVLSGAALLAAALAFEQQGAGTGVLLFLAAALLGLARPSAQFVQQPGRSRRGAPIGG